LYKSKTKIATQLKNKNQLVQPALQIVFNVKNKRITALSAKILIYLVTINVYLSALKIFIDHNKDVVDAKDIAQNVRILILAKNVIPNIFYLTILAFKNVQLLIINDYQL
jgi:hypothetical protein